jgi:hypothetical protein
MLIGYALSSDLHVNCLQRFEQRFLIPLQLFPKYDIRQLWALVTREQAPGPGQRQRPEVPETAAEQDETVEGLAEAELADLDAQPADPVEDVATDSTDEDYQPIPWYRSPRPHDHEAGGSGSPSRSDLAMVAILERLT